MGPNYASVAENGRERLAKLKSDTFFRMQKHFFQKHSASAVSEVYSPLSPAVKFFRPISKFSKVHGYPSMGPQGALGSNACIGDLECGGKRSATPLWNRLSVDQERRRWECARNLWSLSGSTSLSRSDEEVVALAERGKWVTFPCPVRPNDKVFFVGLIFFIFKMDTHQQQGEEQLSEQTASYQLPPGSELRLRHYLR